MNFDYRFADAGNTVGLATGAMNIMGKQHHKGIRFQRNHRFIVGLMVEHDIALFGVVFDDHMAWVRATPMLSSPDSRY